MARIKRSKASRRNNWRARTSLLGARQLFFTDGVWLPMSNGGVIAMESPRELYKL